MVFAYSEGFYHSNRIATLFLMQWMCRLGVGCVQGWQRIVCVSGHLAAARIHMLKKRLHFRLVRVVFVFVFIFVYFSVLVLGV